MKEDENAATPGVHFGGSVVIAAFALKRLSQLLNLRGRFK
jgi:hypothetical protein